MKEELCARLMQLGAYSHRPNQVEEERPCAANQ